MLIQKIWILFFLFEEFAHIVCSNVGLSLLKSTPHHCSCLYSRLKNLLQQKDDLEKVKGKALNALSRVMQQRDAAKNNLEFQSGKVREMSKKVFQMGRRNNDLEDRISFIQHHKKNLEDYIKAKVISSIIIFRSISIFDFQNLSFKFFSVFILKQVEYKIFSCCSRLFAILKDVVVN